MKLRILPKSWGLAAPVLGFSVLLLGAGGALAIPQPLVEFLMNAGSGTSVANTGTTGGAATLISSVPSWSTRAPVQGGTYSLDFGTVSGEYNAVDLAVPAGVKNLKSFTLSGWLNCRSSTTGVGGNRVVTWQGFGEGDGVDLAYNSEGKLQLGVNGWNDMGGFSSNGGKIPTDASGSYNNWRFFAVTYNSTASTGNVKFYFGSNTVLAELDVSRSCNKGMVGSNTGSTLTVGHHTLNNRPYGTTQMFRGLIDNIRIHGSATDGSGALSLSDIRSLQNATVLTGEGVLYEEWAGISGTSISNLTTHSSFPSNPSATLVRPSFDGFLNRAENYGVRMSGWIKAPESGDYEFWIASDDNGELRISTDANPVNKVLRASVAGYTGYQTWGDSQKSGLIPLVAGQFYFIEALMKEGGGGDHLSVAWKLPSGAFEAPIPAGRVFLQPDDGAALFPSAIHLYEAGTVNKKTTVGWQKEAGNSHFYIETEGEKKFRIRNDVVSVPRKLFFGGLDTPHPTSDVGDLGFRYERNDPSNEVGLLTLENENGEWAFKVHGTLFNDYTPYVEFNERLLLSGPNAVDDLGRNWDASTSLHHFDGLGFSQFEVDAAGIPTGLAKTSLFNGEGLLLKDDYDGGSGGNLSASTRLVGGSQTMEFEDTHSEYAAKLTTTYYGLVHESGPLGETPTSRTEINSTGLETNQRVKAHTVEATNLVTTPKWRVASSMPDYVFDKDYKLMNLEETEAFVRLKKHLPEVPSSKEMHAQGVNLADMNLLLLKKVEELTLHVINLNKEIKDQKARSRAMEKKFRKTQVKGGSQ